MEITSEIINKLAGLFFEYPKDLSFIEEFAGVKIEDTENFRIMYDELFFGCGNIFLPLWESACVNGRNILLDETTLKMKQIFCQYSICVKKEAGLSEDYFGAEIAFVNVLLKKGAKKEDIQNYLEKHLIPFAKYLYKEIEKTEASTIIKQVFKSVCEIIVSKTKEYCFNHETEEILISEWLENYDYPADYFEEKIVTTVGRGNCGGRCIIKAHVEGGCVLRLSTDNGENSPVLKACSRGHAYRKTFLTPNRLRYPMKRVGERGEGKFIRISWEEAIDTIAKETKRIKQIYGPGARYINYASGINATLRGNVFAKRLLAYDGGFLDYYNTYSAACTETTTPYIYGTATAGSTANTLEKSKMIMLWGFNPVETMYNGELLEALRKAKERNIPIVVVDPRFSDTAATFATKWIGLRPTTDGALAAGMAYTIMEEKLLDLEFLNKFCIGFDKEHMPEGADLKDNYKDYLLGTYDGIPKDAQWASEITGVDVEDIKKLAIQYASCKPAALIPGLGPQRHGNGEQTVRATAILACITGNVGIEGGYAGASCGVKQHVWPMVPVPENPYPGVISCFQWTRAICEGKAMTKQKDRIRGMNQLDADIKLIYNLASNTLINQHSDCYSTDSLLKDTSKCEFIVVSDIFMTPSARYADILLPGASMFETCNLNLPWREGNFLLCSMPAIECLAECKIEYDWLVKVAEKLGIADKFTDGKQTSYDWQKYLYDKARKVELELPDYDEFEKNGGHKYSNQPHFYAFKEQIENFEQHPFMTPSGKIEIYSQDLKETGLVPALPIYVPSFEGPKDEKISQYPLQLIGWHNKFHTHSVHDNNEWTEDIDGMRLVVNRNDALNYGLHEDEVVQVYNDRGKIEIKVHITERIVEGVVAMPQGGWFENRSKETRCINVLTTLQETPLAKGNPQHSNLVQIKKIH